jgi:LysR family glycine cleavage system transcriptional activator
MHNGRSQTARLPWLNTLVAFEAAARLGSLTLAAAELNLTPGAVSRQVKQLEQALDAVLFGRSHNAIELTAAGRVFLSHTNAALAQVRAGMRAVSSQPAKLSIRAPLTLTQRWLIPRIDHFRRGHPGVDLRFQTISAAAGDRIDVEIKYVRDAPQKDDGNKEIFLVDRTAPVCRPELLAGGASPITPSDVLSLPVLQDTADGWSWRQWCKAAGIAYEPNGDSMVFDTDEASIDACLSGLGVAQANTAFVTAALEAGTIRHLCPSVDATLGAYYAVVHARSNVADAFVAWLKSEGEAGHRR